MDAVKYLEERDRMCDIYFDCADCPMGIKVDKHGLTDGYCGCREFEIINPQKAVKAVEKWSQEIKEEK